MNGGTGGYFKEIINYISVIERNRLMGKYEYKEF